MERLQALRMSLESITPSSKSMQQSDAPNDRGFELFHRLLGDMVDDYWTHLRHGQYFMRHNVKVISPEGHATDIISDWACDYLNERGKSAQPFFLYLPNNAPHDPVQPPPNGWRR